MRMKTIIRHGHLGVILIAFFALTGCVSTGQKHVDAAADKAAKDPAETAKLLASADEAVSQGNLEAALPLYAAVLQELPTAQTWLKSAVIHNRLGHDREAGYAFSRVLALEPDNVDALEQIGLLYVQHEQVDQAREYLERAIALDPSRWRAYNGLGVLADMQKDYSAAVTNYQAALAIAPNSAMLLNNAGYSRYLAGDLDAAAATFIKSLSCDTTYAPARRNLALLYARKGAYRDAVQLLSTVVTEAVAYNDIGYVAMLKGDYASAERLLQEAVDRSPTYYELAARNLAAVREQLAGPSKLNPVQIGAIEPH
jgi:Flp pilus assembly protein TadD